MLLEMVLFRSFLWLSSIALYICEGFPGGSDGKESACRIYILAWKILWTEEPPSGALEILFECSVPIKRECQLKKM